MSEDICYPCGKVWVDRDSWDYCPVCGTPLNEQKVAA